MAQVTAGKAIRSSLHHHAQFVSLKILIYKKFYLSNSLPFFAALAAYHSHFFTA